MAQSGSHRDPAEDGRRGPGLASLRGQIDKIDREIVDRMNQRAELARRIGAVKQSSGQQTYDPAREEMVLERVTASNKGPL